MDAVTLVASQPAFELQLTVVRAGQVLRCVLLREPCQLTLGSSTACDVRVAARGVRPKHLVVAWDGLRLAVNWAAAPDAVRRDGMALAVPFIVETSTTLQLGEALLCLELLGEAPPDDAPTIVMSAVTSATLASVPEAGRVSRRVVLGVAALLALGALALMCAARQPHSEDVSSSPSRSVPLHRPEPSR